MIWCNFTHANTAMHCFLFHKDDKRLICAEFVHSTVKTKQSNVQPNVHSVKETSDKVNLIAGFDRFEGIPQKLIHT